MQKLLKKMEIKRFNKLANKKTTVLFTNGDEIEYIYDKETGKRYYPKNYMEVVR